MEWDGECKIRFCKGKEWKNVYCVISIAGIYLAYAIWPESMKHAKNDAVDLVKIMGSVDFCDVSDHVLG
jgi:transposase